MLYVEVRPTGQSTAKPDNTAGMVVLSALLIFYVALNKYGVV